MIWQELFGHIFKSLRESEEKMIASKAENHIIPLNRIQI